MKKTKCDCSKCIYGFKHKTEGCGLIDTKEYKKIKVENTMGKKIHCSNFKKGNKYYKKYLETQVYGGESFDSWIKDQPISERYKYLPSEYAGYPSMCIGSTDNDVNCIFREDGHIGNGCEYCWKKYGSCIFKLQRDTSIFIKNKESKEKDKRIIHMLIDIMIKLVILILILIYFI